MYNGPKGKFNILLCVSMSMSVINTKDRRKVESIIEWSLELVKSGKAEETLNWDKSSTWYNSKFKELESGNEWVVYISDHAWPGEVKIIEP
jgi:hypothetical protein